MINLYIYMFGFRLCGLLAKSPRRKAISRVPNVPEASRDHFRINWPTFLRPPSVTSSVALTLTRTNVIEASHLTSIIFVEIGSIAICSIVSQNRKYVSIHEKILKDVNMYTFRPLRDQSKDRNEALKYQ